MKKLLTYSLVITTIIWSVGILSLPVSVSAAVAGDLVKYACPTGAKADNPCKAVYYLGSDLKRYVFPNEKTYKTWYPDFSGVKTISKTELESYTFAIGSKGQVTYKPGVKLVKFNTDPKVYAVSAGGSLRWVTTEAVAVSLYGSTWNKQVDDLLDTAVSSYTVGSDITNAANYAKATETANATSISVDKGLGSEGTPVATGSGLTVSLASDTPASGIVVGSAAKVPFTTVNFTASSDGDAIIDQLVVRRTGLAADGSIAGVVLIDAATNEQINSTAKTFNSSHDATFNEDITIPAGTTKKIVIAANMASLTTLGSYAGEIPVLTLQAITLKGSTSLSGTLPISGNYQTVNSTIAIATVNAGPGADQPTSDTAPAIGTTLTLADTKIKNNSSVEKIQVESITFTQSGSVADGDVIDLKLYESGSSTVLASLATTNNKKAIFTFSTPFVLDKGKDKSFTLKGTVDGGSARTIDMDIWYDIDIKVKGLTYGYYIIPSYFSDSSLATARTANPLINDQLQTIGNGTIQIESGDTAASSIAEGQNGVKLGAFKVTVKGEPVEVTSIGWQVDLNTSTAGADYSDITNLTVYDPSGLVVAGPADPARNTAKWGEVTSHEYATATTTDTITFPVGTSIYTVKADLSSDFNTNDTIRAVVYPKAITAKGETTGNSLTTEILTTAAVQSAIKTIKAASVQVSTKPTPAAQTVIAGTQGFTFANFELDASASGDDLKVSQFKVPMYTNSTSRPTDFSGAALYDGSTLIATSNNPDSDLTSGTADADATVTFTFSSPLVISKNTKKTLTFKASISASAASGSAVSVGIGSALVGPTNLKDSTGTDVTALYSTSHGQTMTIQGSGTLTVSKATSPTASIVSGGQTVTVLKASAVSSYEDMSISEAWIDVGRDAGSVGGSKQLVSIEVYDGTTKVAEGSATNTANSVNTILVSEVSAGSWSVSVGTTKTFTFKAIPRIPDYYTQAISGTNSIAASGQGFDITFNPDNATVNGTVSGTVAAGSKTGSAASANDFYVFKAVPKFTLNDQLTTGAGGGSLPQAGKTGATLYAFKVTADGGDIGLYNVSFWVSTATATLTPSTFKIYDGGTLVATATTLTNYATGYQANNGIGGEGAMKFVFTSDGSSINADFGDGMPVTIEGGSSKTFTLKGDITCSNVGSTCGASTGSGSVNVYMVGNNAILTTAPGNAKTLVASDYYKSVDTVSGSGASFLWTDYWRTLNSASGTATSTEQWWNGYLVRDTSDNLILSTSSAATWTR